MKSTLVNEYLAEIVVGIMMLGVWFTNFYLWVLGSCFSEVLAELFIDFIGFSRVLFL